jgi:hypothetical protein
MFQIFFNSTFYRILYIYILKKRYKKYEELQTKENKGTNKSHKNEHKRKRRRTIKKGSKKQVHTPPKLRLITTHHSNGSSIK